MSLNKEMEVSSTLCKHEWVVDPEDKRFKICMNCGKVAYRTDDDVTTGVRAIGWEEAKHGLRRIPR